MFIHEALSAWRKNKKQKMHKNKGKKAALPRGHA